FRPARVVQPQAGTALATEMPRGNAARAIRKPRMVDADVPLTLHAQRLCASHDVDRVTATAGGLAADGAVAAHVRIRRGAVDGKMHRAAMAGSFKMHGGSPLRWRARCEP